MGGGGWCKGGVVRAARVHVWFVSWRCWSVCFYVCGGRVGGEGEKRWGWFVTYEWVMSYLNESCHVWMSHTWMSLVTCAWVMSHMNDLCHTHASTAKFGWSAGIMTACRIRVSHVTYERVTSHMNHLYSHARVNSKIWLDCWDYDGKSSMK